jgi:hypothetical protein
MRLQLTLCQGSASAPRDRLPVCGELLISLESAIRHTQVSTGPSNTAGPGFDPIIGQAAAGGDRMMDEPVPNYPTGDRRSTLDAPHQFVVLTAAAYFFVPSITAIRTVLTD